MKRTITIDAVTVRTVLMSNPGKISSIMEAEGLRRAAVAYPNFRCIDKESSPKWGDNGTYSFTAIYQ